jgi:hypothetical protein
MSTGKTIKKTSVAVVMTALLIALVSGTAFAQDRGGTRPGILSSGSNGFFPGLPMINLNDPAAADFVGSFLGTFLGTMVTNNQNNERDWNHDYYYNGDRDRSHDRNDRRTERPAYPWYDGERSRPYYRR